MNTATTNNTMGGPNNFEGQGTELGKNAFFLGCLLQNGEGKKLGGSHKEGGPKKSDWITKSLNREGAPDDRH